MKRLIALSTAFMLLVCVSGCCCKNKCASAKNEKPKYVFYFIGDGMGKPHVDLARMVFGKLNMDSLPVRGSVSTVNALRKTTDSAAAGTALACGSKTLNGRLGIDANGKELESVAVVAKKHNARVAIMTTVGVNNATPAAFYAHVFKRGESKKIMEQYPASKFDILMGYGVDGLRKNVKQEDFLSGKAYLHNVSGNADNLKGSGIRIINKNEQDFFGLKKLDSPILVYFSFGTEYMRGTSKIHPFSAYLQKAVELLQDSPNGFFIMAEGGHIDHGGHANNGQMMLGELKEFDRAIGKALEFYKKHPNETLIVVTADHHTGGLSWSGKVLPDYCSLAPEYINITNKDNADTISQKLEKSNIKSTPEEKKLLAKAFAAGKKRVTQVRAAIRRMLDKRSGIKWSTTGHTADEVYLFAIGIGAQRFSGHQENNEVALKLKSLYK